MGVCDCFMFFVRYFVSILVLQSSWWGKRAGCDALFVFLVSRDGWGALPRGATGLSAVCDCGISGSYSLTIFNTLNKLLTQKHLKQGYQYHKLRKTFSKFYRRYCDLISKFQVGLKSLLRQVLLEPDFYGDLVYKLKKIVGSNNFSAQFIKIISHY